MDEEILQDLTMHILESRPQISLNALSGVNSYSKMRIKSYVGKQVLHIFMNIVSTHNFLAMTVAKKLNCKLRISVPLEVSVAHENQMWLSTLGDILWNFDDLTMDFHYKGKRVVLRGSQGSELSWLQGAETSVAVKEKIREMLDDFKELPYKHPPNHKDVVELMVKELLDSSVIRNNNSPFSSPVIMVKKKDELLDELQGAKVFSKLDLRSGYHQIRMREEDIHKITFRTHEGHYDSSLAEHLEHLRYVLQLMQTNTLFAKHSKCTFAMDKVEYLGRLISEGGVFTNPSKIQAMRESLVPNNVKQLRGFLGLTSYYRRFIKNYALMSHPLTRLLKNDSFQWSKEAQIAFLTLKEAMITTPVLALANFNKEFVIETYACDIGFGDVLTQDGHPLAYLSKSFSPKHQVLSTYEKEYLGVLMALDKWRGFDYEISYKKRNDNVVVVDALSMGGELCALAEITKLQTNAGAPSKLMRSFGKLLEKIHVTWTHLWKKRDKIAALHEVVSRICSQIFFWKGLRKLVKHLVKECEVCPRDKLDLTAYPGLLQPLPIPTKVWFEISMYFIESLLKSHGKTVIFVVVNTLSKYAHFMAMSHPFTASDVAKVLLDNIYKLWVASSNCK
ncbi:retrotransposon-related protein [Tanacetum coccineum]